MKIIEDFKIIDIDNFGDYRLGLTSYEIELYLVNRLNSTRKRRLNKCPKWLINRFYDIAGCNTVAVSPNGQSLMYRYDCERFADKLFLNKDTYFD